jgi:hypothetical protein
MYLAALVGGATLGGAFFATEGCGSVPADVDGGDGGAHDATVDTVGDAQLDAQLDGSGVAVCPGDAGYYITINGDGVPQTLSSNWGFADVSVPAAFYEPPCARLFVIAGSENPDGGTLLYFQISSNTSPPPAPLSAATVVYARPDGAYFHSAPDFGQPIYTEVGAPGGLVAGSYAVTVATSTQPDAATLSLSGTFCTLRLPDGPPQPCPP